ncbi:MAG: hypothetical protein KKB59_14220 [Spirochaetes bacterium]|nr:hypothetical protein [Spirochaetota bacterium]
MTNKLIETIREALDVAKYHNEDVDEALAALDQLAAEIKPQEPSEDADDGEALRSEAEFQCDRWLELPRNYSDICPKYGHGDRALKACGFIDGFLMHSTLITARDARLKAEALREAETLFGDIWERLCPAGWDKGDWVYECMKVRRDLTDDPKEAHLVYMHGEAPPVVVYAPCPECGSKYPNPHAPTCSIGEAFQ